MNEENQISYYSVIPATVRYDEQLKPAEKLIYSEITSLTNKFGYSFATNKYFAKLYNVTTHTVSQWISHLDKLGYIHIELIKNENGAIDERRIYIRDTPYVQKNTYPCGFKSTYPMYKKVQYNNIKYNIDDVFNLIMKNSTEIQKDFYSILDHLEFLYTQNILNMMKPDKIQMLKEIIYVLYELFNSNFDSVLSKVSRESLLSLYTLAQENGTENKLGYFKKSIINKYGSWLYAE